MNHLTEKWGGRIIEAAPIDSGKEGKLWRVVLIRAGWSKNDRYYPRDVLEKALPLFEGLKAKAYCAGIDQNGDKEFDHISQYTRPEGGAVANTVGWYDNCRLEESGELTADFHVTANWLKEMLLNAWREGKQDLLGFSIDGTGNSEFGMMENRNGEIVRELLALDEVTVVDDPAAGGRPVALVASMGKHSSEITEAKWDTAFINDLPDDCFAFIEPGGKKDDGGKTVPRSMRHLPYKGPDGKLDMPHLRNALARLDQVKALPTDKADIIRKHLQKALDKQKKESKEENTVKEFLVKNILKYAPSGKYEEANLSEKTDVELQEIFDKIITEREAAKLPPPEIKKEEPAEVKPAEPKAEAPAENKAAEEVAAKVEGILKQVEEANEKLAIAEGKALLKESIDNNFPALHEGVRSKVEKLFEGRADFKAEDVIKAVRDEKEYLGKFTESGKIKGLGDQRADDVKVLSESSDRMQADCDKILGVSVLHDGNGSGGKITESYKKVFEVAKHPGSLRKMYVEITGDVDFTGRYSKERLTEATSGDWTNILGTSINRRLLQRYNATPDSWREFADITNIDNFKSQERVRYGGLGRLETITESDSTDYPLLSFASDEKATYTASKRGGRIPVSLEMIINDDLRALINMADEGGEAASETLNQFVYDLILCVSAGVINAGTIYDSTALYTAGHNNLQATAYSYDAHQTIANLLWNQKRFGYASTIAANMTDTTTETLTIATGKGTYFLAGEIVQIGSELLQVKSMSTDAMTATRGFDGSTAATHTSGDAIKKMSRTLKLDLAYLIHPRQIDKNVKAVLNSEKVPGGNNNDNNEFKGTFKSIKSPYLRGDVNNYIAVCNPAQLKGLEIGFLMGKEQPELFVQNQPLAGNTFMQDATTWKIRHIYGGAITDLRAFAAGIVT